MSIFLGIVGAKGGVAKTTSAINLADSFRMFGRDVIIVDGNLSTPNLGLHLGVPTVPISLHDALKGKNDVTEALYLHPNGLKIVPAGISLKDWNYAKPEKLNKVLPGLDGLADIVIVDGSAGLGAESLAVIKAVDDLIVVTNPELPSVTDALKTIKLAQQLGKNVRGAIVTRVGNNLDLSISNIETILEKPVLATIPDDDAIRKSLVMKNSVIQTHPSSKAAIAYKKLAAELIGVNYSEERDLGLFTRVLKKLGLR